MDTSYSGKYVTKLNDGHISEVHVSSIGEDSFALDPDDYVTKGISPPLEKLPSQEAFSELERAFNHGDSYQPIEIVLLEELVFLGYMKKSPRPIANCPEDEQTIINYDITDEGLQLLGQ